MALHNHFGLNPKWLLFLRIMVLEFSPIIGGYQTTSIVVYITIDAAE